MPSAFPLQELPRCFDRRIVVHGDTQIPVWLGEKRDGDANKGANGFVCPGLCRRIDRGAVTLDWNDLLGHLLISRNGANRPASRSRRNDPGIVLGSGGPGGGCFWGVQGVFQHVDGVSAAVSGYAGGTHDTAQYHMVGTGTTGHAESVQITFDPRRISYGRILQIYFSVAHDSTELNHQGPDTGTQYRSTIFTQTPEQARIAKAYIAQLSQAGVFRAPIVTTIEPDKEFYPAEAYHQDYLTLHPSEPYIAINDIPKVEALARLFPDLYKSPPVLVAATQRAK